MSGAPTPSYPKIGSHWFWQPQPHGFPFVQPGLRLGPPAPHAAEAEAAEVAEAGSGVLCRPDIPPAPNGTVLSWHLKGNPKSKGNRVIQVEG